ncbi:diguanylate cyclase (GGDEF) domain-containing protein [Quadrisphaera granulorum]|uniref:Diguanylate cyclase (GGDEF)-like protein n=1 Tax=Quadrisphaera granulorum TaxID=317664 RepID=A0A316A765_9ACTN|nr:sensor domain-containing diguanylate cyclase [Quadrisphaera granulorum]PWJ52820.1 diguanylate cyclase (GGDEF)-like protein [Quadrisphaera granulorum]SZE97425.1 diguanylate cyclase (GGDEF) domain-containing protein [Quadrisphaera granulorum]
MDTSEPDDLRARQHQVIRDCDLLEADQDADLLAVTRTAVALTGHTLARINVLLPEQVCSLASAGGEAVPLVREETLCHRASLVGGPVVSSDCSRDPRFADLPWVDGRLGRVRRYAMAPLQVDGLTVGTLCVLDEDDGPALTEGQVDRLADLAAVTSSLLQRRRQNRQARADHDELARARAFDRALLQALPLGVLAADAEGRLTLVNDTLLSWYGGQFATEVPLAQQERAAAYSLFELDGVTPLAPERLPMEQVLRNGAVHSSEWVLAPPLAPRRTVSSSGAQVRDADGRLLGAVLAVSDITERRALEEQLRRSATHDVLTGLPNRALLVQCLTAALTDAPTAALTAAEGRRVAVLYCDLDGFKAVNDSYGHAAGDAVLRAVAGRLRAGLRPGDVVARLGGDEFVLVCPGIADLDEARTIASRLAESVSAPIEADGALHRVGVSVGAVLSSPDDDGGCAERLLSCADAEMYASKRARRQERAGGA